MARYNNRPPTDANLNTISQEFSYNDIRNATNDFCKESELGKGTYGTVFKGTLRDGTEVAIKLLSSPKTSGFKEEVEVLSRHRHPNLVILLGFARGLNKERILVYELLDCDLCQKMTRQEVFGWKERVSVATDTAVGLSYLHNWEPKVFHRDIKTQNILLTRSNDAKVADFGLACLAQRKANSLEVENCSGTLGYADPLYIHTSIVNEKSEVYSFGMVLLEILTARAPALQMPNGRVEYPFEPLKTNGVEHLFPMLDKKAEWPVEVANMVGSLALRCISENDDARPRSVEIVTQLRQFLRSDLFKQMPDAKSQAVYVHLPTHLESPWYTREKEEQQQQQNQYQQQYNQHHNQQSYHKRDAFVHQHKSSGSRFGGHQAAGYNHYGAPAAHGHPNPGVVDAVFGTPAVAEQQHQQYKDPFRGQARSSPTYRYPGNPPAAAAQPTNNNAPNSNAPHSRFYEDSQHMGNIPPNHNHNQHSYSHSSSSSTTTAASRGIPQNKRNAANTVFVEGGRAGAGASAGVGLGVHQQQDPFSPFGLDEDVRLIPERRTTLTPRRLSKQQENDTNVFNFAGAGPSFEGADMPSSSSSESGPFKAAPNLQHNGSRNGDKNKTSSSTTEAPAAHPKNGSCATANASASAAAAAATSAAAEASSTGGIQFSPSPHHPSRKSEVSYNAQIKKQQQEASAKQQGLGGPAANVAFPSQRPGPGPRPRIPIHLHQSGLITPPQKTINSQESVPKQSSSSTTPSVSTATPASAEQRREPQARQEENAQQPTTQSASPAATPPHQQQQKTTTASASPSPSPSPSPPTEPRSVPSSFHHSHPLTHASRATGSTSPPPRTSTNPLTHLLSGLPFEQVDGGWYKIPPQDPSAARPGDDVFAEMFGPKSRAKGGGGGGGGSTNAGSKNNPPGPSSGSGGAGGGSLPSGRTSNGGASSQHAQAPYMATEDLPRGKPAGCGGAGAGTSTNTTHPPTSEGCEEDSPHPEGVGGGSGAPDADPHHSGASTKEVERNDSHFFPFQPHPTLHQRSSQQYSISYVGKQNPSNTNKNPSNTNTTNINREAPFSNVDPPSPVHHYRSGGGSSSTNQKGIPEDGTSDNFLNHTNTIRRQESKGVPAGGESGVAAGGGGGGGGGFTSNAANATSGGPYVPGLEKEESLFRGFQSGSTHSGFQSAGSSNTSQPPAGFQPAHRYGDVYSRSQRKSTREDPNERTMSWLRNFSSKETETERKEFEYEARPNPLRPAFRPSLAKSGSTDIPSPPPVKSPSPSPERSVSREQESRGRASTGAGGAVASVAAARAAAAARAGVAAAATGTPAAAATLGEEGNRDPPTTKLDHDNVQMLISMGFTQNQANAALTRCSSVEGAVEYLIQSGQ